MEENNDIRRGRHCGFSVLRKERPDITKRFYYKGVLWSPSYFVSSCSGALISIIRQYMEQRPIPT